MNVRKSMQGGFPGEVVDDGRAIGDDFDEEEVQRSLVRAKRIALANKQEEGDVKSGSQARALFVSSTSTTNEFGGADIQDSCDKESREKKKKKKMVFTEMDGFFSALKQDDVVARARAPNGKEDVFVEVVKESVTKVEVAEKKEEEIAPDESIREVGLGKGLVGTLKLLKDRGALKESVEWGGRNMDKKKSKLFGIHDEEINIERRDEWGRVLTPKEAFRALSHKFHGVVPSKKKQEKRMRQYHEDLMVKQMTNYDTPNRSVERTREALAQQKSPYLVISGPRSK